MTSLAYLRHRVTTFTRDVAAVRGGPIPRSGMTRSGCAVGLGFLLFVSRDRLEAGLICAVFTNLLCLSDRARTLEQRLWVQGVGALLFAAAGAIGVIIAGNDPLILVTTFAFALFAGFVHGTLPGVEALPRYALVCLIAAAYLPVGTMETLAAVTVAAVIALAAVAIDDHIRNGRRGVRIARINATVYYPGPRFSIAYGMAAVTGLGIGLLWGQTRPYWVTITTLLVMQPDRRANTVRVMQRFVGTILGVVLAFAVTQAIPAPARSGIVFVFALVLPFLWPWGFERNYGLGVALLSLWVLLLIDFALPGEAAVVPVFVARLSDTAIGCAVALAGSFVVYETREPETA